MKITFTIEIEQLEFARFKAHQEKLGAPLLYIALLLEAAMNVELERAGGTPIKKQVVAGSYLNDEPSDHEDEKRYNNQQLKSGMVEVVISVHESHIDHARKYYLAGSFFNATDYLHGELNSALMKAMANYDDQHVLKPKDDWRPDWLLRYLNRTVHISQKIDKSDPDSDIPF